MRNFLIYVLLRLAIFVVCFGVLFVLFGSEASPWLVALLALVFTSGLALLLLRRQADSAGQALSGGVRTLRHRMDAAKRREDDTD